MDSTQKLARRIIRLEREVRHMRMPQLAYSSIEDGALAVNINGEESMSIGRQYDGSVVAAPLVGPTPPQPAGPVVAAGVNSLRIRWGGAWASATDVAPMDFNHIAVYAVPIDEFVSASALDRQYIVGHIPSAAGGEVAPTLPLGEYVVYLVAWSLTGKFSSPSSSANVSSQAVGAGMLEDAVIEGRHFSATTFTGSVITGAKIRTAVNGRRAELNTNGWGELAIFTGDTDETEPGRVTSYIDGDNYGIFVGAPKSSNDSADFALFTAPTETPRTKAQFRVGRMVAYAAGSRLYLDMDGSLGGAFGNSGHPRLDLATWGARIGWLNPSDSQFQGFRALHESNRSYSHANGGFESVNRAGDAYVKITCSALTQTSDRSAKENIGAASVPHGLSIVRAAPTYTYDYKDTVVDAPHRKGRIGVMAEDLPDTIASIPDLPEDHFAHGLRQVDVMQLVGVLWEAVRDLDAELDAIRSSPPSRAKARI